MNKQTDQNVTWCMESSIESVRHVRDIVQAAGTYEHLPLVEAALQNLEKFLVLQGLDEK